MPVASPLPPGPRLPPIVQTARLAARPLPFLAGCRRRYGSSFTINAAPYGEMVYISEPDDIRRVFTGDPQVFHTGEAREPLELALGKHSLLLLDEEAHLRERRLMLPSFHGESLRRYESLMRDIAAEEMRRWPHGEPFALRPRMQALTLEVILQVVIGARESVRLGRLREALGGLANVSPLVLLAGWAWQRDLGPWSPYGRMRRLRDQADELLNEEIAIKRAEAVEGEAADVLSLLVAARDEDGSGLSDLELRDELATLLLAGHETTATGLAWTFERLIRHPETLSRLRESIAAGEDDYLEAVVKESLRVRPVVAEVARYLTEPTEIAGNMLPAGTTIMSSLALVQFSDEAWGDPAAFRPERFLDDQPDPYTWIPFGGGTRRCLGAAFATMEMKAVLREVIPALDFRPVDPAPERAKIHHVTLVPEHGARVIARQLGT